MLEWVPISSSRESPQLRDQTCIGRQILYHWAIQEAATSLIGFERENTVSPLHTNEFCPESMFVKSNLFVSPTKLA